MTTRFAVSRIPPSWTANLSAGCVAPTESLKGEDRQPGTRDRYGKPRNRQREHVKGNNNHCPHSPFSHASSASSYVKETTRLFPLGSTVVDRGSGSLTAQASLSTYRSIAVLFSSFAAPHAIRTSLARTELTADPHPFFIPYCSVGYGPVDRA